MRWVARNACNESVRAHDHDGVTVLYRTLVRPYLPNLAGRYPGRHAQEKIWSDDAVPVVPPDNELIQYIGGLFHFPAVKSGDLSTHNAYVLCSHSFSDVGKVRFCHMTARYLSFGAQKIWQLSASSQYFHTPPNQSYFPHIVFYPSHSRMRYEDRCSRPSSIVSHFSSNAYNLLEDYRTSISLR